MKKDDYRKFYPFLRVMAILIWILMTADVVAQTQKYDLGHVLSREHSISQIFLGRTSSNSIYKKFYNYVYAESLPPADFAKNSPYDGETNLYPEGTTLTWFSSDGATSYEYCYDTSDDDACSTWVSTESATEVELTGLSVATTYYWQVRAINAGGTTYADGETGYWHFTTIFPPPPAEFNKYKPYYGETNLDPVSITLEWFGSSSATSYEYCYDTSDDDACSTWVSTGSATEVTLNGLELGTIYYWQVRAINLGGTTYADGETGYWHFTTRFPPPPAEFNKHKPYYGATNLDPVSITLEWFGSSAVTSYEYCYDTSDDDACSTWVSTGSATEVTLSGLSPATTYYWQVRAINIGGTTYADGETSYWNFTTEYYHYYLPLMRNE